MDIILASTSAYRKRLLGRLQIPFRCVAPLTDETPLPQEEASATAARLALAKAEAVAERHPDALVIGSDQVAALGRHSLGKPGNFEAARTQLASCGGKSVDFYTGVALVGKSEGVRLAHTERFRVTFRQLTEQQIEHYLLKEEPYDCAGSFKVEGLGISLSTALHGNDPTSLEGLPLIALTALFSEAGFDILSF